MEDKILAFKKESKNHLNFTSIQIKHRSTIFFMARPSLGQIKGKVWPISRSVQISAFVTVNGSFSFPKLGLNTCATPTQIITQFYLKLTLSQKNLFVPFNLQQWGQKMKRVETWSTKLGKCKLRHGFKLVRKLLETKK